ncbi:MAG: hypothetical protein AAF627_08790 [Myxococcota bacterium]
MTFRVALVCPVLLGTLSCGSLDLGDEANGGTAEMDRRSSDLGARDLGVISPTDQDMEPPSDAGAGEDALPMDVFATDMDRPPSDCDYRFGSDGALRIEAEDLPLVDAWEIRSDEGGFSGRGYILWTGSSSNNRPGNGLMHLRLAIPEAGRYRFQWRNRIGRGDNTTEHNDTWVRFPDAADFYGLRIRQGEESRRYPEPICEDEDFMEGVRSRVAEARCAEGSTRDGWMKVYSSGARDWRWSTRTSDNDAHDIFVEFDQAGTFTLELSQRADFHLIDRLVLHREDLAQNEVEDERPSTPCL